MDGFGTNTNVIVPAATNRGDILIKHWCGQVVLTVKFMDLPDVREREEILKFTWDLLKKVEITSLDTVAFSINPCGFSGLTLQML
jgi:cell division protease FtsH